jgi:hypothetical protein
MRTSSPFSTWRTTGICMPWRMLIKHSRPSQRLSSQVHFEDLWPNAHDHIFLAVSIHLLCFLASSAPITGQTCHMLCYMPRRVKPVFCICRQLRSLSGAWKRVFCNCLHEPVPTRGGDCKLGIVYQQASGHEHLPPHAKGRPSASFDQQHLGGFVPMMTCLWSNIVIPYVKTKERF